MKMPWFFLVKRACMPFLALPVLAFAHPVVVITHSSGTSNADDTILWRALGLNSATTTALLPYELTLVSTFDTDANPASSSGSAHADGDVVIDFHIGSQVFHYEGKAYSTVIRYAQSVGIDSYQHAIEFDTPGPPASNFTIQFSHTLYYVPDDKQPGEPLAMLDADESDGVYGYYSLHAFPGNPDVPLSWNMASYELAALSVQVAAVPEPATWALWTAGLLCGWGAHRRAQLSGRSGRAGSGCAGQSG